MEKLTRVANKCGTDKGTEHFEKHGYTEEYGKYVPETGEYSLLEIGVYHCESMRMWQEYNPDLLLVGLDIDSNVPKYMKNEDDFALFIGDASNAEFIEKVVSFTNDEFDFIVDDGSHRYEDILASFKLLYPQLKKGGYYFIEDLHAPYAQSNLLFDSLDAYLKENGYNKQWQESKLICNNKLLIIQK